MIRSAPASKEIPLTNIWTLACNVVDCKGKEIQEPDGSRACNQLVRKISVPEVAVVYSEAAWPDWGECTGAGLET